GLDVAPMPEDAQAWLKKRWPPAGVRNPVDTTAQVVTDLTLLSDLLDKMLDAGGYDAVVLYLALGGNPQEFVPQVLETLAPVRSRYPDRLIMISALWTPEIRAQFTAAGFLTFDDPSLAVQAAA